MFVYEKRLQYPIHIRKPNPKLANIIITQYGGPDGELGASLRYLSQRYSMPDAKLKALLTDIGTEELGHLEMIGTLVHQLTRNLSDDPDVNDVIKFLRAREVVHFQRFGEAMEVLKDQLDRRNIYAFNPALTPKQ